MENIISIAQDWREQHGYQGAGGVVIVFEGEGTGWMDELRSPEQWVPGSIAVDESGSCWNAIGGNPYDGAKYWVPILDRAIKTRDKQPGLGKS